VSHDANTLKLDVVDQATKMGAGVYPILSYAPPGTYDPAQPWSVLNDTAYTRWRWDGKMDHNAPVSLKGESAVILEPAGSQRFFRLELNP